MKPKQPSRLFTLSLSLLHAPQALLAVLLHCVYRVFLTVIHLPFYLRYPSLIFIDTLCMCASLFYKIKSRFSLAPNTYEGAEFTPGELSYLALYMLGQKIRLLPHHHIVDLGAGFGQAAIFLSKFTNATVLGIELQDHLALFSQRLVRLFCRQTCHIQHANFQHELPSADVYLVPATCLSPAQLRRIAQQISQYDRPAWVIGISAPLPLSSRIPVSPMKLPLSWGLAHVYIQRWPGSTRDSHTLKIDKKTKSRYD